MGSRILCENALRSGVRINDGMISVLDTTKAKTTGRHRTATSSTESMADKIRRLPNFVSL